MESDHGERGRDTKLSDRRQSDPWRGASATVAACLERGPARFHLVVPATPLNHGLVWTEGEAHLLARRRLTRALRQLRDLGIEVGGEVGDADPILAIADALREQAIDEIILFTLPPGLSRWLRQELPRRVTRRFGLPVRHVTAPAEPAVGEPAVAMPHRSAS